MTSAAPKVDERPRSPAQARRAGQRFGAADRLRETSEVHLIAIEDPEFAEHLDAARSRFEDTGWTQAYDEGQAMTFDETVACALEEEEAGA